MAAPRPQKAPPAPADWSLNPSQLVLLSFAAIVAVGALLLSLPWAHAPGTAHRWVDDLFTAASAVCVTGLVTIDPGTSYSLFGQVLIMVLIQVGGLGYMTLFTLIMVLIGRRMSMRDRLNLQASTDQPGMMGLVGFIKNIVAFTLAVEAVGLALLALETVPAHGWGRGLYLAAFHTISAFNNAGFSLFPDNAIHWQHDAWPLLVLSGLVIVGGLGYNVNRELVGRYLKRRKPDHRWDTLILIVLAGTIALLLGSTALIWWLEHDNVRTFGGLPWGLQLANAFFLAVQPRTAGFNNVDMAHLTEPTLMSLIPLMFIGAGPGGTAGGIKLTTAAVMIAAVYAAARGQEQVRLFGLKRRVGEPVVRKAFTVMFLSVNMVMGVAIAIAVLEPFPFSDVLFETVSAFATVGLSTGITGKLSDPSKLMIVATMLAGRVGVLTLLLAVFTARDRSAIRYQEEPLLIG